MTQSDDDDRPVEEKNREPHRIHNEDQFNALANEHLDKVVAMITEELPEIYRRAGGNTDSSVVFSYLRSYIIAAEKDFGAAAHLTTVLMCAAAITRLVRAPRTDTDPLAQLEKELRKNDDHN